MVLESVLQKAKSTIAVALAVKVPVDYMLILFLTIIFTFGISLPLFLTFLKVRIFTKIRQISQAS